MAVDDDVDRARFSGGYGTAAIFLVLEDLDRSGLLSAGHTDGGAVLRRPVVRDGSGFCGYAGAVARRRPIGAEPVLNRFSSLFACRILPQRLHQSNAPAAYQTHSVGPAARSDEDRDHKH